MGANDGDSDGHLVLELGIWDTEGFWEILGANDGESVGSVEKLGRIEGCWDGRIETEGRIEGTIDGMALISQKVE